MFGSKDKVIRKAESVAKTQFQFILTLYSLFSETTIQKDDVKKYISRK